MLTRRLLGGAALLLALGALPALAQDDAASRAMGPYRFVEVIDGDTIRVEIEGKIVSLRLLGIDTEETFHDDAGLQRQAEGDFEGYVAKQQGDRDRPTKYGTPFGEEAARYAERFFAGVEQVTIENDDPDEKTGAYGRLLSYVFIEKDGKRLHYNVEVVRQGYSPYYTKYGRSRHYEAAFLAAEKEARASKRGIWGDWKAQRCYPDYEARLKWWGERAEVIDAWRARVSENEAKPEAERDTLIDLSTDGAYEAVIAREGKSVVLFATIDRIRHLSGQGSQVVLSVKRETVPCDLKGRVNDGGKYNREIAIVRGQVTLDRGRPRLEGAVLELPTLELQPIPAEEPQRSEREPEMGRGPERLQEDRPARAAEPRIKFHYQGAVGEGLKRLSIAHRTNVAYGALPEGALDREVRVFLNEARVGDAVEALARAASLPIRRVGGDVFVIAAPPARELSPLEAAEAKARRELFEAEAFILETLVRRGLMVTETQERILEGAQEARRLLLRGE